MLIASKEIGLEVKAQTATHSSRFSTGMQGSVTRYRQIINPLRMREAKIFGKGTNKTNLTAY